MSLTFWHGIVWPRAKQRCAESFAAPADTGAGGYCRGNEAVDRAETMQLSETSTCLAPMLTIKGFWPQYLTELRPSSDAPPLLGCRYRHIFKALPVEGRGGSGGEGLRHR